MTSGKGSKNGNTVVIGLRVGSKSGAYTDFKKPNGDRFRVLDKNVSDEAKRRAAKVIRERNIGRLVFGELADSRKHL